MLRTRRHFLRLAGTLSLSGMVGRFARAQTSARVVVVGGGFGGATCAKYLRRAAPHLDVTLVTPTLQFVTCPFSNTVLVGLREMPSITQGYQVLQERHGVHVIQAAATMFDPVQHRLTLSNDQTLPYDRLVLAPGIDLRWDAITGYDAAAGEVFPHAWVAGPQTILLRRQLEAMADGGVVVIAVPEEPFRCPPGPYERASLIANYLKTYKPRSKLLILDANDSFSKQALFRAAWERLYPGLLEWVPRSQSGRVVRVDAQARTVHTDFEDYKPAVANIIPPQRAAAIARLAGLDEGKGWCAIQPQTFASVVQADIHILGDAAIANPMPKSAFSANNQAKACAAAIVALLQGNQPPPPVLINTCYSLVAPEYGISITGIYRVEGNKLITVEGTAGTSPLNASDTIRVQEARYAMAWYDNITADTFA